MTDVMPLVADAPEPTLTIDGPTATITGVRHLHQGWCGHCMRGYYVATDGGTYTTGVEQGKNGPRWYERDKAGGRPQVPDHCPHCGKELRGPGTFTGGSETVQTRRLLNEAWAAIRARYPDLVREADLHR